MTTMDQENLLGRMTYDRLLDVARSMYDALWCIVNTEIRKGTNRDEILELWVSMARLELEKCKYVE